MAIENIPIEEFPLLFGRRLVKLAREKNIGPPSSLATTLYDQCYDLVNPAKRKNKDGKYVKDRQHDIAAITRTVQRHYFEENAINIQSKYLLAYSKIFKCSVDYFFDTTKIKSCDLNVRDICEKLNIDEEVVLKLMEGEYDPNPEVFSYNKFWSEIMLSDLFEKLPELNLCFRMELLEYKDLEKKIAAIKKAEQCMTDSPYRAMLVARRNTLEQLQPWKWSRCDGALGNLSKSFYDYIRNNTESWADTQHVELADNYYDNELKKIETLSSALEEGSTSENVQK